jgi:MFS superfamily sulfate permease-like transporter
MRKIIALFIACIFSISIFAQSGKPDAEMADLMRGNGRIYVVVAVMLTILIGLVLYIIRLDKKISNMEKENKN